MKRLIKTIIFVLLPFACLSVSSNPQSLLGQDWLGLRGNNGQASVTTDSARTEQSFELKTRWKVPIGSGYSGVCVRRGRIVTMFTEGDNDVMACLDASNGERVWTSTIGPRHVGEDGSFDGPIATPLIHDEMVFGLSAKGRLLAVSLADGSLLWEKDLAKEWTAPTPMYGFSTSPILVLDTLVLQVGGTDASLVGLDPKTGSQKWKTGSDLVMFQTGIPFLIDGQLCVLAAGNLNLTAVRPDSGSVVFDLPHEGSGIRGAMSMMPVPVSENRVLLTFQGNASKVVSIDQKNGEFVIDDVWESATIRNSYSVPVAHEGYVYGYNNRFLTCVDANDGKAMWRSRKPGDGFLMIVDGHLITATKKGSLHVAKATPSDYQEISSLRLFEDLVWTMPSFADGSIFVRSLGELARVDLASVAGPEIASAEDEMPLGETLANAIKDSTISDFIKAHPNSPFIEDGIAHFWYFGDASDVAVGCDVFGARQERNMKRVGDTNFYYCSTKLLPTQRANYIFYVDFKSALDPRNDRAVQSTFYVENMEFASGKPGEIPLVMNWFAMPEWQPPSYTTQIQSERNILKGSGKKPVPLKLSGKLTAIQFKSELAKKEIPIEVYTPQIYDQNPDQRFPVVYVHDGANVKKHGEFELAVDRMIQSKIIDPAIVVFINEPLNPMAPNQHYADIVGTELVEWVDDHYRTVSERKGRSNYAAGFASMLALETIAGHPDKFSACAIQTPVTFGPSRDVALSKLASVTEPTRFYVEWGNFDVFNPHENFDMRQMGRSMFDELANNKHFSLSGGQVVDTTDWSSWRNRFDVVMKALLND